MTMWQCPECGRSFKKANQKHICGAPLQTVEQYIASQPESLRPLLISIREALRAALPDAVERISYKMPTYWKGRNIIHFAAFRNHISIFPGDKAIEHFSDRLKGYKTSKGTLQLPLDKPLPLDLITEIAVWSYETNAKK